MSIFSLSLFFLSPLISFAVYILVQESQDPLRGFHESFRRNLLKSYAPVESSQELVTSKLRRKRVLGSYAVVALIFLIWSAKISSFLILVLLLIGYLYWEKYEVVRIEKRKVLQIDNEFPSLIELFTVLVSAGESPSTAFERLAKKTRGELAKDFAKVVAGMKSGLNLSQSLEIMGTSTKSVLIRRFCDTLILAIERGSPLAEVLQRQVQEVRAQHQADLLTSAGRAEIALMIPVIFLILPISVLFALWPSYLSLGQSVGSF
jgi:tight adherence protein C